MMGHSYLPIDCVFNFTRRLLRNRNPRLCKCGHQFGIHQSKPIIFADSNEKQNSISFKKIQETIKTINRDNVMRKLSPRDVNRLAESIS